MKRFQEIGIVTITILMVVSLSVAEKVPFKVLYNHDGTYMLSCVHPWRQRREDFTEAMLIKSIEELVGKGIDAVAFNPGNGIIP